MRLPLRVVTICCLLFGCQSAPPPMSLDEAKKLTADFQDQGFVPPPRTTIDIAALLEQAKPDTTALRRDAPSLTLRHRRTRPHRFSTCVGKRCASMVGLRRQSRT